MDKKFERHIFCVMISLVFFPFLMFGQQNSNDYKKFLGVWRKNDTAKKWVYGDMKISESNGIIYVQMKTLDEGVKKTEARINNGTLQWSFVQNRNYGKWKLGAWWKGEYRAKLITVYSADGSYGTDGDCSGVYPNYKNGGNNIANQEIEYINFKAELIEGNMKLYYNLSSDYCDGDIPLFYQSSNWVFYDNYTNW